jgi:hypothetical protein
VSPNEGDAPTVKAPAVKAPAVKAPAVKAPAVKAPAVKAPAGVKAPGMKSPAVKAPATKTGGAMPTSGHAGTGTSRGSRTRMPGGLGSSGGPMAKFARIGGVVLGVLAVVTLLVLVLGRHSIFGSSKSPQSVSVFHLKPGTCLNPPAQITAELSSVETLPCHTPHTEEVYALVDYNESGSGPGANYPGTVKLTSFAQGSCLQQFAGYVGIAYQDSSLFYTYLLPSVRSWSVDDRTVTCIITTTGAKLTSSVKGSKQ